MTNDKADRLRSFSGTHDYRAGCVSAAAELAAVTDFGYSPDDDGVSKIGAHWAATVTEQLESGRCPRCRGKMPEPPMIPAGSRVTACRCIPICCGSDEATYPIPLWRWPTSRSAISRRRNKLHREHPPVRGVIQWGHVITSSGVGQIIPREHPGGWAEFGHDDDE